MDNYYALVMAGGSGTRFWPLSRKKLPKQFLRLDSRTDSLIKLTHKRLRRMFEPTNIFYVANPDYAPLIINEIPEISESNIILEPMPKNTAPAIGLSAAVISKHDENAVLAVLPSDHYIKNEELFVQVLKVAYHVALDGNIITIGITPDRPETGFGYIKKGALISNIEGIDIHGVEAFIEKPNRQKAIEYLSTGRYLWNAGIFIFTAKKILQEMDRLMPNTLEVILKVRDILTKEPEKAREMFSEIQSISIDYGIMEKVSGIRVIPADIKWSDVGSWGAVRDILSKDSYGNVNIGENILIDCQDCIVRSENKTVAIIGMNSIAVISTDDAILVTPLEKCQDVKKVVDELEKVGKKELI
ncbi:MAG: sugar phosphate nucleotidyltransferase [Deltaproteobacteria bacterium]|nr:sugar phosphate nucleotidyltransferase [Deltaproteobacteria bacterium]